MWLYLPHLSIEGICTCHACRTDMTDNSAYAPASKSTNNQLIPPRIAPFHIRTHALPSSTSFSHSPLTPFLSSHHLSISCHNSPIPHRIKPPAISQPATSHHTPIAPFPPIGAERIPPTAHAQRGARREDDLIDSDRRARLGGPGGRESGSLAGGGWRKCSMVVLRR